jgi:hypothetical protein
LATVSAEEAMTMTTHSTNQRRRSAGSDAGLVFVGVLMIGLAVGILTGQMAVAALGALGVGFFAMSFVGGMRGTTSAGGLAFTGCLFVGISAGLALGNAAVGALAGLGVGFILLFVSQRSARSD